MPAGVAWSYAGARAVALVLAGVLVLVLALIGFRKWKASRITPQERERRRRAALVVHGKMGDAELVDIREELLFYSYGVRGVEYTASQDITALHPYIPPGLLTIGSVSVRYDPKNPANSIVLSEEWSGLRASHLK